MTEYTQQKAGNDKPLVFRSVADPSYGGEGEPLSPVTYCSGLSYPNPVNIGEGSDVGKLY